jgi:hypothetical protein
MFLVYRNVGKANYKHLIYHSEAQINNAEPRWREITLPLNHWCGGSLDTLLTFEFWDWNSTTRKVYIGEFSITTFDLFKISNSTGKIAITKLKGRGFGSTRGDCYISNCEISPKKTSDLLLSGNVVMDEYMPKLQKKKSFGSRLSKKFGKIKL